MFRNFQSKQEVFNKELNDTVSTLKQDIIDNSGRISVLEDDNVKQNDTLLTLRNENKKLKDKTEALQRDLNIYEQLSLQNTLEIHGIPQKPSEDLLSTCCDIAKALQVPLTIADISNVYRVLKKNAPVNATRPPLIVLKLTRQAIRDDIIRKRKLKTDFSTIDLGWPPNNKQIIHIREPLSFFN